MAKKLLLMPEDMYKDLISTKISCSPNNNKSAVGGVDESDDLNFEFVKKNLEKSRNKRTKNMSDKNVNYWQEFRRFMKLRKDIKDRPLKVQLSNGAGLLVKDGVGDAGIIDNEDNTEVEPLDLTTNSRTFLQQNLTTPQFIPSIFGRQKSEEKPPSTSSTTNNDFFSPKSTNSANESPNLNLKQKLYDYLMTKADTFNINSVGQFLQGTKPIKDSNIYDIIDHHFQPGPGTVSPKGYPSIRKKLIDDPYIKNLVTIFNLRNTLPKRRSSRIFTPSKNKSSFSPNKWTL